MKEGDGDFYNYVRMHYLCLVVLLQKSLCHIQVCTPPATDVPCAETNSRLFVVHVCAFFSLADKQEIGSWKQHMQRDLNYKSRKC